MAAPWQPRSSKQASRTAPAGRSGVSRTRLPRINEIKPALKAPMFASLRPFVFVIGKQAGRFDSRRVEEYGRRQETRL